METRPARRLWCVVFVLTAAGVAVVPFVRAGAPGSLRLDVFLVVTGAAALAFCAVLRERERAVAALRASESRFRQLAEALPQIVWATGPGGTTEYLNRRWTEYTGLPGASADEVARVIHPDDADRMNAAWAIAHTSGAAFQYEFRLRPANGGAYRWFLARAVPLTGPDAERGVWFGTSTDIDELKQTQTELTKQRAELQLILDAVPALIFHKDRNHRLVRVNNELVRVMGLPREAIEGRTDSELGSPHEDDYRLVEERIMTTGRGVRDIIEPLHTFAGTRWLQTAKLPYRDAAGRTTGIIGFSVDITDRKRAEDEVRRLNVELEQRVAERTAAAEARTAEFRHAVEALREQKQLLQTILDSLGEAVLVFNADGKFLLQNKAFQRLHAVSTEHLAQTELARAHGVYLPDGVTLCPTDRLPIVRAINGESCDNVDLMIVAGAHPGGVHVSVTGRPIVGPNGIEGGVIAVRDVSTTKRATDSHRESEERYALAVRGSQDGIWDWDMRTGAVYYSPRWKDMLGYEDHEVANRFDEWERLLHPDDLPRARAALGAYLDGTADAFGLEVRMLHKDGGYRWIYTRGVVQSGPDGRPYRMGGSHTDVTARRTAEAALRESEKRFRAIFDQTFQFIGLFSVEGTVIEANQTALVAAGVTGADVLGKPFWDTAWWAHDPATQVHLRGVIARVAAGESVRYDTTYRAAGGQIRWADFSLKPFRDEAGTVALLIPEGRDITDAKRGAETLAATEALLRQFVKHAPAAIAMLDTEMRYVQTSDRWLTDYRLTERDIIGRSHYEVFPDVPERWKEIHQRVLAGAVESCAEDPFPRADGETEWLQWEARPWHEAGGAIGGVVFYTQVITERKRAERAVRESEEQYRETVEAASDAIVTIGPGGRIVGWNRGAERVFGYARSEALGRDVGLVIPPRYTTAHEAVLAAFDPERSSRMRGHMAELVGLRKGGVEFPVEIALATWGTGDRHRFTAIIRDVTERRLAERAIRESEQWYRTVVQALAEGVVVQDRDGRIVTCNDRAPEILGLTPDQLTGRSSLDPQWRAVREDGSPFPGDEHPAMVALRTGEPRFNTVMGIHKPNGELRWVTINAVPVPNPNPAGAAVVASFHDVTEIRAANEQLRASVREKEVMLKEIHHRVKNNLQIISTLLDLQSDGIADPAALAAFRESRGRVRSMALIHERLYRSENLASVEFGAYVRNLAEDLFRAYRADDEAIQLRVSVRVPPVPLDIAIPCGLLVNELISNCLKYAFAGRETGIIAVSLERAEDGRYALTIADNGVGLPDGFDFRTATSFGLQLANTLAAQLGGELALERTDGTRFIIRFPVRG